MKCIKDFAASYKADIIALLFLVTVYLLIVIMQWGYWGNLFTDCGREAFLPAVILKGKILFKDVFAMYAPLPYQINALLYMVFKPDFNLMQIIGVISSLFILAGLYRICRFFTSPLYSCVFGIFVLGVFMLRSFTCINYVFPYCYAIIYALAGAIYFTLFSLMYIEQDNKNCMYAAGFFMGISVACKPEFILCYIPFLVLMLYKKIGLKAVVLNLILFILPSLLSWGILFLQGFTFEDLSRYFVFLQNFFASDEQKFFNEFTACNWNLNKFMSVSLNFVIFVLYAAINISLIYVFPKTNNLFFKIVIACILYVLNLTFLSTSGAYRNLNLFSWIGLSLIFVCIFLLYKLHKNFDKKLFMLLFLSITAITACLRTNLLLFSDYAIYLALLPAAANFIFIDFYIKNDRFKNSVMCFLIISSIFMLGLSIHMKKKLFIPVQTPLGRLYSFPKDTELFENALKYTLENTSADDTVLMLPEGVLLNFVTGRNTNTKLYHLIPNHIAALGEKNIITELQTNPPDYIYIADIDYYMYGKSFICKDFGVNFCNAVYENYQLQKKFDGLEIYKHK